MTKVNSSRMTIVSQGTSVIRVEKEAFVIQLRGDPCDAHRAGAPCKPRQGGEEPCDPHEGVNQSYQGLVLGCSHNLP